jgi:hypothetical protein
VLESREYSIGNTTDSKLQATAIFDEVGNVFADVGFDIGFRFRFGKMHLTIRAKVAS